MRGGSFLELLKEKERGYLFGLFEGDGYKFYDKNSRHYHVEFYLNSERDKPIINYIFNILKKMGLNPSLYQDKRCNCKRVRVYSKKLFYIIEKNVCLKDKSKKFIIGFVSGVIDAEAHVNKKKSYIMVVNTDYELLIRCQKFLKSINIESSISKRKPSEKEKLDSYRMYISVKFKKRPHLSLKVGGILTSD